MTGHIYRDVILEQVRLLRGAMGAEFLFMDDNACPHRANIEDECLQSEDITRMDWPAYSPDSNPIEHVGDNTGVAILEKLKHLSSSREIHLQWVPLHVNIAGNEIADSLAKDGAAQHTMNLAALTYSELHSTYINNKQSTVPPVHHCYIFGSPKSLTRAFEKKVRFLSTEKSARLVLGSNVDSQTGRCHPLS
ncbi:RNase H domain-containing protein [Trichonephila clavipes]|nr:RNase H domain-containing protein [Trichonephila clavipes]